MLSKRSVLKEISAIEVPKYLEDVKDDVLETIKNHTLLSILDSTGI